MLVLTLRIIMNHAAEKFADAARAAYTAYREINIASEEASLDTITDVIAAAFKSAAIAFDAAAIITIHTEKRLPRLPERREFPYADNSQFSF